MKTKNMILTGLFIALSVALAYVVIPSPTGTVAFDSLPGFVAGAILGPVYGSIVGALGHMATAARAGFFMGIPAHIIVAIFMAIATYVFGFFYRKGQVVIAIVLAVIINGLLALIPFGFLINWGFVVGMLLPLLVGSLVNIILAAFVSKYLKRFVR